VVGGWLYEGWRESVGTCVGEGVRLGEGRSVGCVEEDGTMVDGEDVGDGDGGRVVVGGAEGTLDEETEGLEEGAVEWLDVGSDVGCNEVVGETVGADVDCNSGLMVGDEVGMTDGLEVGADVILAMMDASKVALTMIDDSAGSIRGDTVGTEV